MTRPGVARSRVCCEGRGSSLSQRDRDEPSMIPITHPFAECANRVGHPAPGLPSKSPVASALRLGVICAACS